VTTIVKSPAWYQSRLRLLGWGSALALLSLPAIAMLAGADGVDWSVGDFIIFAIMLLALGGGIELASARSGNTAYRFGAITACGIGFLTIWANLAVGMIGSEENGYNMAFFAIVLLAAVGAAIVRGTAPGLAKVSFIAGLAQLGVGAMGYAADPRGAVFSMMFAAPWMIASALFSRAARQTR
jgi:hypothetical protein